MPATKTYHKNYIKAVKIMMADVGIDTVNGMADHFGMLRMTLYKIMHGDNPPTVDHCIDLLQRGKISANWLFLNKGEMKMEEQATLQKILKAVTNK